MATTPDTAPSGAIYQRTADIPLDELTPFPGNAKRGNVPAILNSLRRNGQYRSLIIREVPAGPLVVLAGNHTMQALELHGPGPCAETVAVRGEEHPCGICQNQQWEPAARCEVVLCDDDAARRINLADNRTAELGTFDNDALTELLSYLDDDYEGTGYTADDVEALITPPDTEDIAAEGLTEADQVPPPPTEPVTKMGDLWLLGPHRLLCGDSTDPAAVKHVTGDNVLTLIHADPPYGMGKEADGVLNDNLYREKLDAFQMRWWKAWLPALADNGSAYIWGNAPDLWRLWWTGGLGLQDDLLVRNEIVWDKGSGIGMRSAGEHSYPTATERCLFLMRGQQFLGNQNKDDFWEGYEPLRAWLCAERDKAGWTNRDINQLTGTQMAGHWFTRSQFSPIPTNHYKTLQGAAAGRAFTAQYEELFAQVFPEVKGGGNAHRRDLSAKLRESRTYFDNTHDAMTDVWSFPRVVGEERHGHATPKPVAMVERAMKSSSQSGDVIGAPFGGSGPDFIAADHLGRTCVGIELEPSWVDVICRRYQEHTGTLPVLEATGEAHDFTQPDEDGDR